MSEDEYVPVESWHIDDLVVDRFRSVLGKRAVVQRIPYRKDVEVEVRRSFGQSLFGASLFGAYSRELLRRLTAGTRCTRYVFVTPGTYYMDNEKDLIGLGIHINTILVHNASVYAVVKLTIYDGETFSLLYSTTGPSYRKVDEPFWPDPPSSAAQNARLREATREAVAQRLDTVIANLKGIIAP